MSNEATEAPVAKLPQPSLTEQILSLNNLLPESTLPAWQFLSAHPFLGAILIAFVSYLLSVTLRSLLVRFLGRITGLSKSPIDNVVLQILRKPVFITVFFFGLVLATAVAQLPLGSDSVVRMLLSIITLSWMSAAIKISSLLLRAFSSESRIKVIDTRTVPLFDLTSKLFCIMIGIYVLLLIWGINPVGWLASAGIAGLAIGFAAKDTLANLFSGFFIVADSPYKIGDYINLDSGERGKVTAIGLRSTRILTRDDVEITIPNGVIANAKIINESGGPQTIRMRIVVSVAYGSDIDQVTELLLQVAHTHQEICTDPEPRVRLRTFGDSGLNLNLMCWISKPEDRGRIAHELHIGIYKTFNKHHIEIPYSKQDIYIKDWPNRKD